MVVSTLSVVEAANISGNAGFHSNAHSLAEEFDVRRTDASGKG